MKTASGSVAMVMVWVMATTCWPAGVSAISELADKKMTSGHPTAGGRPVAGVRASLFNGLGDDMNRRDTGDRQGHGVFEVDAGTGQVAVETNGRRPWSTPVTTNGRRRPLYPSSVPGVPEPAGMRAVSPLLTNPLRLPGQYHDEETGLHYNYHRYYHPGIGRYLRPDPIGLAGGINPFVYAHNNPVNATDPFGQWPRRIHDMMISEAFAGLPPHLTQAVMKGSAHADTFQAPSFSYMHAMRADHQSPEIAKKLMNAYLQDRFRRFRCEMAKGDKQAAYFALGEALHPIMDATSPSHEGFQPWGGLWDMPGREIFSHWIKEQFYHRAELTFTVGLMRDALKANAIQPGQ